MVTTAARPAPDKNVPAAPSPVVASLARPGLVRHTVPAWGASVMGTGIVGIAAHTLPVSVPGLSVLADLTWALACALLIGVVALNSAQARRHPQVWLAHLTDRRTAPATGTLAMACLTVGTSTLLVGGPLIGAAPARLADICLYAVGTVLGLATTAGVPLLLITRRDHGGHPDVTATWLLPVVPPMVSAAAGGVLAQHLSAGTGRASLVVVSLMLFGLSLFAALLMLTALWARLLLHGAEPGPAAPSLWVVLGPLGQGATALGAIAIAATGSLPAPYPAGLAVAALVGGAGLLGFAALWAAISTVLTARASHTGMAFSLGWWSFTFPVGTCVTGLSGLATRTGLPFLRDAAVAAFVVLLTAWVLVAVRTARAARAGRLLSPLAT